MFYKLALLLFLLPHLTYGLPCEKSFVKRSKYASYQEASQYAIANQIQNVQDWKSREHPAHIPKKPDYMYEKTDEWQGWHAFLGKERVSYAEARQYAIENQITTAKEWRERKHPPNIPNRPDRYFSKTHDWTSWYDFLGKVKKNGSTPEFREHLHQKLDGNKVEKNSDIFIMPPLGMSKRRRP